MNRQIKQLIIKTKELKVKQYIVGKLSEARWYMLLPPVDACCLCNTNNVKQGKCGSQGAVIQLSLCLISMHENTNML